MSRSKSGALYAIVIQISVISPTASMLSVRVNAAERAILEAAAEQSRTSLSEFVRSKALESAQIDRSAEPDHCHHPIQGLGRVRGLDRMPGRSHSRTGRTRAPNAVSGRLTYWLRTQLMFADVRVASPTSRRALGNA